MNQVQNKPDYQCRSCGCEIPRRAFYCLDCEAAIIEREIQADFMRGGRYAEIEQAG